ncbi:WecB/TagA/CpsF family glycosyltransferase [Aliidiomarina celeris]|uniref:WecB/TagA/CpsF family glycosyltransferase n=1 Tax=Aliidiomarina celeris TaxID=2249428 RepID=UPI000DE8143B|nr:WecB/TagA/CpsF family glycosyltransferase [Aliidiomarina celeris]
MELDDLREGSENIDFLGYKVSLLPAEQILKSVWSATESKVVNTINPHSYAVARSDQEFKVALQCSSTLIPDGVGIVYGVKILEAYQLNRLTGPDFFRETMRFLNERHGSALFLGSTDIVLELIKSKATTEFPNVKVDTFSPAFKVSFDSDDIAAFSDLINLIAPDVVFVGLTAPKQEKLIEQLKGRVKVKMLSGIGAAFDFYAGTVYEPSGIWAKFRLEWFRRLLSEPKRLWKRTFISAPLFILDVFKAKLGKLYR